ncbi:hypothetical protein HDU76_010775 [Blyttiomyces sp. JEL0837]|nr:hypothetical protein HDU76_010775 [Blyttiomyces sp. JEL0837]
MALRRGEFPVEERVVAGFYSVLVGDDEDLAVVEGFSYSLFSDLGVSGGAAGASSGGGGGGGVGGIVSGVQGMGLGKYNIGDDYSPPPEYEL